MEYYIGAWKNKYAVFNGRSRRREFWMFMLFNLIAGVILGILSLIPVLGKILVVVYSLAVLCPAVGMGIRRLHDTGKSGWWLLALIIPMVLRLFFDFVIRSNLLVIIFSLIYIVFLIVMIVFWCKDSDPGDNKYGPNPKQG